MSTFKVAGVSTLNGKTKVRFANDLVSRVKMLNKSGHTNIQLEELSRAMTKPEIVTYLKQNQDLMSVTHYAEAINLADEKYNASTTVKVSKPNLDAIKARAGIKTTETA
jgi:hypothetical protein